jgi:hypothetical protein
MKNQIINLTLEPVLGWVIGAYALLLVGAAGASAEVPTSGPGVFFSPFYYQNPGNPERDAIPPNDTGFWQGVTGPLSWTNPGAASSETTAAKPNAADASGHYSWLQPWSWQDPIETSEVLAGPLLTSGVEQVAAEEVPPPPHGFEPGPASGNPNPPANSSTESVPAPGGAPSGGQAKRLSEAESLGEEPPEQRLQFLRAQSVLLKPGELQIDVGLAYSLAENDFPVVQSTGSGNQILEATFKQRQLIVPLEFRLGITRRMQAFLSIPVGAAQTEFSVPNAFEQDDASGGLGDISFGSSFLLVDGNGSGTDVVFSLSATVPSGDSPFVGNVSALSGPTLGNNTWATAGDLLFIDNYDPIVIFYGIGYRHQFEREFLGVDVDPGEEFRAQLGVGFAVNSQVTLSTRFATAFITRTQYDGQSVDGSFSEPMSIRFAATVLRCQKLIEPFAEIGATNDATASRFGIVWTY